MAKFGVRHFIDDIRYRDEWIRCNCGVEVTAPHDMAFHDAHEPLCIAWAAHRAEAIASERAQPASETYVQPTRDPYGRIHSVTRKRQTGTRRRVASETP